MNKAIFLDKDGTLIDDIPYNVNPDLICLKGSVIEGLQKLQSAGYKFIIVSNQSGVARGYFQEQALIKVEEKLKNLLADEQINLEGFYYCPHHPEGLIDVYAKSCGCRKPLPGMLTTAALEHDINLNASWMIGDILNDIEAGNRAGCHSILVDNGGETEWVKDKPFREPVAVVANINQAADYILNHSSISVPSFKDTAAY